MLITLACAALSASAIHNTMQPPYYSTALRFAALTLVLITANKFGQAGVPLHTPICVIEADPHHKGTLLAGTATARLFRSLDGGDTWSPLAFPGASRSTLHAILIDPVSVNVYWVAVSSEISRFAGVFRSVDAGTTWQPVAGLEQKQVWALVCWKVDAHVIAAGTEDGVYITRDGGKKWTLASTPGSVVPRPVVSLAFNPTDSDILYAGTPHLAWKTVDGGATWHPIHKGMKDDSDIFAVDVDVRRPSRLFAAACGGIYRSLDGGRTWSSLEHALGGPIRTYVVLWAPDRPGVVYAGTTAGLIVSPDSGANWYRLSSMPARSVAFDPEDPNHLLVATDEGVQRIDDSTAARIPLIAGNAEERRVPCVAASAACSSQF